MKKAVSFRRLIAGSVILPLSMACAVFEPSQVLAETPVKSNATPPASMTGQKPAVAPAALVANVISIRVEAATGNLVLQSEDGQWFPTLSDTNESGQIILKATQAKLDEALKPDQAALLSVIQKTFPEVTALTISQTQESQKPVVLITLTVSKSSRVTPRILSNTGSLLTLSLGAVGLLESAVAQPAKIETVKAPEQSKLIDDVSLLRTLDPKNLESNPVDGTVRQAWNDYLSDNTASVIFNLKTYLDRVPEDTIARYLLAKTYIRTEEPAAAEKELKVLLSQHPKTLNAQLDLIQLKLNASAAGQSPGDLAALIQDAKSKWPDNVAVLFAAAQAERVKGNTDAAREGFLDVIRRAPNQASYYQALGDLEVKAARPEMAKAAYLQAIALGDSQSAQKLAPLLLSTQPDQAVKYYGQALSPQWLIEYAALLQKRNMPEASVAVLKTAELSISDKTTDKATKDLSYRLGMMFAELKQAQSAQKHLQQFVDSSTPDSSDKRVLEAKNTIRKMASLVTAGAASQQSTTAAHSAVRQSRTSGSTSVQSVRSARTVVKKPVAAPPATTPAASPAAATETKTP